MNVDTRYAIHPFHGAVLDTEQLRQEFLIQNMFQPDEMTMTYSHIDRICVGGVLPVYGVVHLPDTLGRQFGVDFFLQRREMGIINIGGAGFVVVDGERYELPEHCGLYIGKGAHEVTFASNDYANPAKFYYSSCPAHHAYPTRIVTKEQSISAELGSVEDCNRRTINKYFVPDVLETCQLCMGMTALHEGSNWNSMPPHTHERRMEVYFYFNVKPGHAVFHVMGEPTETRHVVLHNDEAIISPPWSMHSGVGTKAYSFIWAMCGENLTFDDMDQVSIDSLR